VLANPAWKAAPLLTAVDAELAAAVGAIPSAPVAVVCLGWSDDAVQHLERGFGFLVPGRERLPILGTLFDTWVFPNRSPTGRVLMRTMIGGARDPGCLDESDAQLTERALGALRRLLDLRADPEMIFVVRHARGIPQYPVGHARTLAQITTRLARYPGLHLAGNSYRGIAMNACIKEAEALANTLAG
jgi:oxygen-dependent protoporphyrinogen oxidase